MIKGVNNYVIEVSNTGSKYYDKAILFIKPEYTDIQKDTLEKEAKKLIRNLDTFSSIKVRRKNMYWIILTLLSSVLGCIGLIVFINMINF